MKKIFCVIIFLFVIFFAQAQDSLSSSTSFGLVSRAYAPATGATLNENPVFELTQVFSKKNYSLALIKSVDFKDLKSSGNYSMCSFRYNLNKSFWIGGALAQFDVDFLPKGIPIVFLQGGFEKTKKSSFFSVKGFFVTKIGSPNTYILKPSHSFISKKGSTFSQNLWLSNKHVTFGLSYLSQNIKLGANKAKVFTDWNLRIVDSQSLGIFRAGVNFEIK